MVLRWAPVIMATSYGTPQNPIVIQTPNPNGAKPTTPRVITVVPFDPADGRTTAQHIIDQQWRDAVALGLLTDIPESINATAPGETATPFSDFGGGGSFNISGPTVTDNSNGVFTIVDPSLADNGDGTFTMTK